MGKRFPTNVRRSNRARHPVYSSLEENCIGLHSDLVNSLVRQANKKRDEEKYARYNENPYFDSRYPRRNRSCRNQRDYEDDPETFSPSPKTDDEFEIDERHNNGNIYRSPIRTRRSRRILEEEDFSDGEGTSSKQNGVSKLYSTKRSRQVLLDEDDFATENQQQKEEQNEYNDSIHVKTRRQQQTEEDSAPPAKRPHLSESEEEDVGPRYPFRQNRARVIRLEEQMATLNGKRGRRSVHFRRRSSRRRRRNSSYSSESSSTSDSDIADAEKDYRAELKFEKRKLRSLQKGRSRFVPLNMSQKEWDETEKLNRLTSKHILDGVQAIGDIEPMGIDKSVSFDNIGGLDEHIQSLKEAVVFPLLYPELFEKFQIAPPKGVLFYGPPGTGKTLLARALANESSKDGQKIAFFMRKGADCLSKWIGESERQLRLLFDQAYKMRPSIIFFDEIDGLAPTRSSRQDQIHSSIVSTLLALLDGLDNRGQVIVIGATNRLDTLDPAIRRPGRFDRELRFDLPDKVARQSILNIHTATWKEKPDIKLLAEMTSGYCGADLKALCAEAVLVAIRQTFPHLYISKDKLEIDAESVQVQEQHFQEALRRVIPASRRDFSASSFSINHRIDVFIRPIVEKAIQAMIPKGYLCRKPTSTDNASDLQKVVETLRIPQCVAASRLILHGNGNQGQTTYFINSFISHLDHLPVFTLNFGKLYANSQPEENLASVMLSITRATSRGTPALLVLSDLDKLEDNIPTSLWQMLVSSLSSFDGFTPLLIIGSVQKLYSKCSADIQNLFSERFSLEISPPTKELSREYFRKIANECLQEPVIFDASKYASPQKAKSQIQTRRMSEAEIKQLEQTYEQKLRQFRIFLRDTLSRLIRDRRFNAFHLPVDAEDAEDYYSVITSPLCLSDMMAKIDQKAYNTKAEFLADIALIRDNALEYNPVTKMEDKIIRHNAIGLMDVAEALFDTEFDDDFEENMLKIANLIKEAKGDTSKDESNDLLSITPRRRKNSRHECETKLKDRKTVQIDNSKLDDFVEKAVNRTHGWPIRKLELLGVHLVEIIQEYANTIDRNDLPQKLIKELNHSY